MKRLATTLAAITLATLMVGSANAITFTGSETDFPPTALLQDDGIDTESFCSGLPLDIGKVYVANDATTLYIGFQYARACFCEMNLGVAFNVRPGGTTVDPFCRAVDWSLASDAPDYYLYDVIPTGCNTYNYEVLYGANGSNGWNTILDGSNGLGIVDTDGGNFVEMAIPLSSLGMTGCNGTVGLELWTMQEGCSKPAFDMVANDNEQRSTPSGTCFDIGPCNPSQPTQYLNYTLSCPVPTVQATWSNLKALYR